MKTKEQILKWLDGQLWKEEFYKESFTNRLDSVIHYNEDLIISAFCWSFTKSGVDVWTLRNANFREWYDSNDKPTSWEEYCKQNPFKEDECYIDEFSNITPVSNSRPRDVSSDVNVMSTTLCEAFLAYMKLMQLRNAWTEDWEALYCSYKIEAKDDIISSSPCSCFMYGLSFPTPEMANEFIKTFKDLLEIAKPLL